MKKILAVLLVVFILSAVFATMAAPTYAATDDGIMRIREAKLAAEIEGTKIPPTAFSDQGADGKNENVRLTKSRAGIPSGQMFRVTRTTASPDADNALRRLCTIYTDRASSVNAEAYMYYIELPEDLSDPVIEIAWNVYDGKTEESKNGHIYNGTAYILAEGSKTWMPVSISNRCSNLPEGFKGFILLKPEECVDIGTSFNENWQLATTHIYLHDLRNQTAIVSRPFIVEKIGDMGFACRVGDGEDILDLFTGEKLTAEQAVYKLKTGDVLYSLPEETVSLNVEAPDLSYLPTKLDVKWQAYDGAASYTARLFRLENTVDGKTYVLEQEFEATEASATFKTLVENARYSVLVYAINADGKEIAISESLSVYAGRGANFDKVDEPATPIVPIIIITAAVLLVIVAVVVVIIVLKKKK